MAKKKLTPEQRLDLLKGFGKGLSELMKSNKAAGYAVTSLGILLLGKAKLISCGVTGTLQGVTTYIAISDTVEEDVDSGFFGIGGMGETIAKGGASIGIGALWGYECGAGRQGYRAGNGAGEGAVYEEKAIVPLATRHAKCMAKYSNNPFMLLACEQGLID